MGIPEALRLRIQTAGKKPRQATARELLGDLCALHAYTAQELCQMLVRSDAHELARLHLKPMREAGVLTLLTRKVKNTRARLTAPWALKVKTRRSMATMPEQTASRQHDWRRVKFGDAELLAGRALDGELDLGIVSSHLWILLSLDGRSGDYLNRRSAHQCGCVSERAE